MRQSNNYLTGAIYCFIATLSWGAMFPIMTHALKVIDPFTFTSLRYTSACIAFLLFLFIKEGRDSFTFDCNKFLLWLFGSAGFAGFGFFVFLGQKLSGPEGALSASMMMATMPLLGLLVNWALKGVKPPLFSFAFIGMSFLGVLIVITKGNLSLVITAPANYSANMFMIAGALCWVLYTIGASYFPKWSPIKYTAFSTLYSLPTIYLVSIALLVFNVITLPSIETVKSVLPELSYMALVAGFIGVLLWNNGNKIITPINGVLFMDVVPVTAFIISAFEGFSATPSQMFGILLTASALIFNNLYQRRRMKVAALLVMAKA